MSETFTPIDAALRQQVAELQRQLAAIQGAAEEMAHWPEGAETPFVALVDGKQYVLHPQEVKGIYEAWLKHVQTLAPFGKACVEARDENDSLKSQVAELTAKEAETAREGFREAQDNARLKEAARADGNTIAELRAEVQRLKSFSYIARSANDEAELACLRQENEKLNGRLVRAAQRNGERLAEISILEARITLKDAALERILEASHQLPYIERIAREARRP